MDVPTPVALVALELVLVDNEQQQVVTWTPELALPVVGENRGAFAYAQRKTELHAVDDDELSIGWLEPGARVGVAAVSGDRATVVLLPWVSAVNTSQRVTARVDVRDLGATAPAPVAPAAGSGETRTIANGQTFARTDGAKLAYTHCGDVELLAQTKNGTIARQRKDGIVLDGVVDMRATWQQGACPGLVVSEDAGTRWLHDGDRQMLQRAPALPDGLVASGPFTGPTFAKLVAKRAKLWWLVDGDGGPACEGWTLEPPKAAGDDGALVHRSKTGGDTTVTQFGVQYTEGAEATVYLLGPSSQTTGPRGEPLSSVGIGCGSSYRVVANEGGVLTMHRHAPSSPSHVVAYDPFDTERWYTDRARCERDVAAKKQRVAVAGTAHAGC